MRTMENGVKTGTLYLCATPIGNLEDITMRVLRIMREVDLIAAEDTRHTQKLLNHFEIHTPTTSYFEHNKREKGLQLVEQMLQGKNIALVSDAGMPGVSDPGEDLVKLCISAQVPIVPVPGPSAVLSALVISGMATDRFIFYGFIPRENKLRDHFLTEMKRQTATIICYESPHRIVKTLQLLQSNLGNRAAAAARELTKRFEEVVRGTLADLVEHFTKHQPRGEFTIVISGATAEEIDGIFKEQFPDPVTHVLQLVAKGTNKKDAIKQVALLQDMPKREVYQMVLAAEGEEVD
jgi:16S rRNA (cytidine1402-2'-O)-methyltransferase